MAEAMILSEKRIAEMYPPSDTSYAAKGAWKALSKGLTVAIIEDENFSRYSNNIRFLYKRSEELLRLMYSHQGKIKMEYVIDHDKLSENKLVVAFSVISSN